MTLRVFVDACVLFSAAYRFESPLRKIWRSESAKIITSEYAVEEARRNLSRLRPESLPELEGLLDLTEVQVFSRLGASSEEVAELPEKDRPILLAAIEGQAKVLITSDKKHFGPFFGRAIKGVEVMSPAMYFERLESVD